MPRQDIVTTDNTLPIFLFDHADESMQHVPSRLFKATMLIISSIGISLAITLWLVGPGSRKDLYERNRHFRYQFFL